MLTFMLLGWMPVTLGCMSSILISEYALFFHELLAQHSVSAFFSLNDFDIGCICSSQSLISSPEACFWGPSESFWLCCIDKLRCSDYFGRLGIESPPSWLLSDSMTPFFSKYVLKPREGSGSNNTFCGITREEMKYLSGYLGQRHLLSDFVVQPMIDGSEYHLDLLYNEEGRLCNYVAKKKIAMRCGETDKAELVDPEMFHSFFQKIEFLPHCGNLDVDVIVDSEDHIYLLDVNTRFGGGFFFSLLFNPSYLVPLLVSRFGDYIRTGLPAKSPYGNVIAKAFSPVVL